MRNVKPGERYRHFKGGLYRVVCIAHAAWNEAPLVVYQSEADGRYWVRMYTEFISDVDREKYPDVTQEKRFERVEEP